MNSYQIIKLWSVHTTVNEWGAVGSLVGYFTSEDKAKVAAEGRGWWGGEGAIRETAGITVHPGLTFPLADITPLKLDVDLITDAAKVRQDALKKLTPREREILGV
jgi:hypothetical protein